MILADEAGATADLAAERPSFGKRLAEPEAVIDRRTVIDFAAFSG